MRMMLYAVIFALITITSPDAQAWIPENEPTEIAVTPSDPGDSSSNAEPAETPSADQRIVWPPWLTAGIVVAIIAILAGPLIPHFLSIRRDNSNKRAEAVSIAEAIHAELAAGYRRSHEAFSTNLPTLEYDMTGARQLHETLEHNKTLGVTKQSGSPPYSNILLGQIISHFDQPDYAFKSHIGQISLLPKTLRLAITEHYNWERDSIDRKLVRPKTIADGPLRMEACIACLQLILNDRSTIMDMLEKYIEDPNNYEDLRKELSEDAIALRDRVREIDRHFGFKPIQ